MDRVSEFALNKEGLNDVKGFCRSKASELWLFQKNRGLAKALMVEAAGLNPVFEAKRAEIFRRSNERIEKIFETMKSNGFSAPYNTRTCALLCNGTLYHVINDWLLRDSNRMLTGYAYPIVIYNLNAFQLDYQKLQVIQYIDEMMMDMEKGFKGVSL